MRAGRTPPAPESSLRSFRVWFIVGVVLFAVPSTLDLERRLHSTHHPSDSHEPRSVAVAPENSSFAAEEERDDAAAASDAVVDDAVEVVEAGEDAEGASDGEEAAGEAANEARHDLPVDKVGRPRAPCAACSNHGLCEPDGSCACAAVWSGSRDCSRPPRVAWPAKIVSFRGPFQLPMALAQGSLQNRSTITVNKDPMKPGPRTEIGKVDKKLLANVPERDPLDGVLFGSCAIVGSSGILLKYEHGADIDAHDLVFRFNSAKTTGFGKHVGTRTTHRITNSRNFGFRETADELVFQHMRNEMSLHKMIQKRKRHPDLRLYGIHPDLHNYIDKSFSFLATSGLFGILIALHRCSSISLYGFQVHPRHGVAYHYYDDGPPANEGRDGEEFYVVKAIVEAGLAKFAEDCVLECHASTAACSTCKRKAGVGGKGRRRRMLQAR